MVGVRQTTIEDIAEAAGVSRITVYRRIGNRDELILMVLLRITDRFLDRLRPLLLGQSDLGEALVLLVGSTVSAVRRDDLRLLFASEDRGAVGVPIDGAMLPLSERFGSVVADLADRFPDQLIDSIEATMAGEWLVRVIVSLVTLESGVSGSEPDGDAWVRTFVLPGLVAPEGP